MFSRLCPGCRSLDGEHDFGSTCTLMCEEAYEISIPDLNGVALRVEQPVEDCES